MIVLMLALILLYPLDKKKGVSLYEQLYGYIREDILRRRLAAGEKLPSKRALAAHLEISVVTVENAYDQLAAEGYIRSEEKRGYFVCPVEGTAAESAGGGASRRPETPEEPAWFLDFVTNAPAAEYFPFDTWARLMRRTILDRSTDLLRPTPSTGALELRQAIAAWLRAFRGMDVSAERIVLGAGTESLYGLLIKLLGRDRRYAVEDPGYGKIARIYESDAVTVRRVPLDESGLSVEDLARFFGVPLYKLQAGKQSYQSNEQQQLDFVTNTLTPPVTQIEQEWTWKLLSDDDRAAGIYLHKNLNALLRGDSQSRAQFYEKMISMSVLNPDEVRALEDMSPLPDGLGKIYRFSKNYAPVGEEGDES